MFVVIFEPGKQPRVQFGVNPATLDQSKILINPVLPRGIPPHRWKKGDNCIEVLPEPSPQPRLVLVPPAPKILPQPMKQRSWPRKLLLVLAALAVCIILRKVL